jgi:hypothetical protein
VSFSADEIIRVIKACRTARVTELKIGDIEVKFGSGETPKRKTVGVEEPTVTESEFQTAQTDVNENENLDDAEDRLDLLQIDDPSLYERLVLERELEDRGKPNEIAEH